MARVICVPSMLWHCWLGGRKDIRPAWLVLDKGPFNGCMRVLSVCAKCLSCLNSSVQWRKLWALPAAMESQYITLTLFICCQMPVAAEVHALRPGDCNVMLTKLCWPYRFFIHRRSCCCWKRDIAPFLLALQCASFVLTHHHHLLFLGSKSVQLCE